MSKEIKLLTELDLDRCPHCNVAKPNIPKVFGPHENNSYKKNNHRFWAVYSCKTCGGLVIAACKNAHTNPITEMYPQRIMVDESIPVRAKDFLSQAIESLHAPAGAVMLAASAVDAMLKDKGYIEGSLFNRIEKAAKDHLITQEMSEWAHEVRLESNDQRHADEESVMPSEEDAKRITDFAQAFAEYLFVLPAKIRSGRSL